jgi:acyl-coenzyme A thioesterase PaaI-like protein
MYRRPAQGSWRVDEVRTLLSLRSGLNGNPRVCHGGIVAAIMDEVMGVLLTVNKDLENAPVRRATVTAFLNVTYLKAVTTPQVVLVTAKFQEVKGRKYFIESAVLNGEKAVLAKANALFVKLNEPKERL